MILRKNESLFQKIGLEVDFKQSNVEGEIVNLIQNTKEKHKGIIINAGGYTHICSNT